MIEWLKAVAVKSPFQMPELVRATIMLQSVGVNAKVAMQTMAKAPELMTAIEAGKQGGRGNKAVDNVNSFKTAKGGNRDTYLAARLKRDHPEIAARVANGEFKSIRAAALEAGIVKPMRSIQVDTPEAAIRALLRVFTVTDLAQALGKAAEVSPPS